MGPLVTVVIINNRESVVIKCLIVVILTTKIIPLTEQPTKLVQLITKLVVDILRIWCRTIRQLLLILNFYGVEIKDSAEKVLG